MTEIYHRSRRTIAGLVVLLVGVMLASSCGKPEVNRSSDSGDTGIGSDADVQGPPPELRAFSSKTSQALCEKAFECCSETERTDKLNLQASSAEECAESTDALASLFGFGFLEASVREGRIAVDETMTDMCIQSIEEAPCSEYESDVALDQYTGCREAFAPQVEIGGECAYDADCKQGYCPLSGENANTCQPLPGEGEDCPNRICDSGFYCDTFEEVCKPLRDVGETCFDDTECKSGRCEDSGGDDGVVCQEIEPICTGN